MNTKFFSYALLSYAMVGIYADDRPKINHRASKNKQTTQAFRWGIAKVLEIGGDVSKTEMLLADHAKKGKRSFLCVDSNVCAVPSDHESTEDYLKDMVRQLVMALVKKEGQNDACALNSELIRHTDSGVGLYQLGKNTLSVLSDKTGLSSLASDITDRGNDPYNHGSKRDQRTCAEKHGADSRLCTRRTDSSSGPYDYKSTLSFDALEALDVIEESLDFDL